MSATDLKQLWQQRHTDAPDVAQIISKAAAFNRRYRLRLIGSNILLLTTMTLIIAIIWHFEPAMWTTKAGALLVISSIVLAVTYSLGMMRLTRTSAAQRDLQQAINDLHALKHKQSVMHSKIMSAYFLLLSSGIFVYMIEYAQRMTFAMGLTVYGLTAAWFAFNWFYLRVRIIEKQKKRIDAVIASLGSLERQFDMAGDATQ